MNIGIIGAGGIAHKFHLPELTGLPDVKVTHLAGRKTSRLRRLAEHFDVPHFTEDYTALLSDDSIDAIVIAAPHPLHVPMGLEVLTADKHLLMQKPLCADMNEANAFLAAADKTNKTVMCLPHFSPDVYAARAALDAGRIGKPTGAYCRISHGGPEVYYAEVRDFFGESDSGLWFFEKGEAAVGGLFDMGVYAVSSMVALLGEAKSVIGMTVTADKPTELEDTASLLIQFANGAIGTAETGWCDPARTGSLRVHGTLGKITAGDHQPLTFWEPGSYTREDTPAIPHRLETEPHERGTAHAHWVQCIREGRSPELSSARLARHVTEILLAGLESGRTGQRISLKTGLN